jgi:endoglucanase Acf2
VIRRRRATALSGAAALVVIAVLAGCTTGDRSTDASGAAALEAGLSDVPHRSVTPVPATRLAPHLVPPTNRWFSGLVFGEQPQPVFPLPLSFALTGSGFGFGVPDVRSTADTISGEYAPAVTVDDGSASSMVVDYDEASVTIEQKDAAGRAVGTVVIAEGSPVVSYTAERDGALALGARFTGDGRVRSATVNGTGYGLVTTGSLSGTRLTMKRGQTAELFAAPTGVDPVSLGAHVSALSGVSVSYRVGSSHVTTVLSYHSAGQTLVAAMPHQQAGLVTPSRCSLGGYRSVYGTLALCSGSELSWTSPKVAPDATLKLGALSADEKAELRTQLADDLEHTPALPADSYFGGKALYRLANLLTLAHHVGATETAHAVQAKLDAALVKWTQPKGCATRATRCLVYDPAVKGMVGLTASFGSDQFNDHAFHYGYFLYAAAVAARYDTSLIPRLKPVMDLLAADIANPDASTAFPIRRGFDAYAGHSWASGYAPFADGNNQESSSEAVDAWNGLGLWAAATDNAALSTEATWMLSAEAASATAYWTGFDTRDPVYDGYRHGVVGINWGGKRDDATWFSAEANAKLGIQLIPMSPASHYLAGDADRIARNIAEAAPAGVDVQFGDYLLMYSALEGRGAAAKALTAARTLPAQFIDDADSRSYLLAWIMARE